MPETPAGLAIRVTALEKRVDHNDDRLEKIINDGLRTDVAVLKVELAGEKKKNEIQDAKLELIESRVTSSASAWAGSKTTILLLLAVIGGLGGLIFGILQATGH